MVTPVGSFAPVSYGNWSLRTKFVRRTAARSSSSSRATVSIVRSRTNAAFGRPAPRIGVLGMRRKRQVGGEARVRAFHGSDEEVGGILADVAGAWRRRGEDRRWEPGK